MPTSVGFQTSFGGGGAGALCEQAACRKRIVEVRVRVYRYNVCAGSILLHAMLWAEGMQTPSVTRMCVIIFDWLWSAVVWRQARTGRRLEPQNVFCPGNCRGERHVRSSATHLSRLLAFYRSLFLARARWLDVCTQEFTRASTTRFDGLNLKCILTCCTAVI